MGSLHVVDGALSNICELPSNDKAHIKFTHISSDAMLEKVADELTQYVPDSYTILLPIRCHQLGEMPQDFYVDQWPCVNICVGILKPEYFRTAKTPPYQSIQLYSRTDEEDVLQQMFNGQKHMASHGLSRSHTQSLPIDWNQPILLYCANKQQETIVSRIFRQHGGITVQHDFVQKFYFATHITTAVPIPNGYEFVRLKPDDAAEVFRNWEEIDKPFTLEDIASLMERFPFGGIREKSTGKLVAYGGQFHSGTSGYNKVDPEHRGKKLFQALISRLMADCVARYGVATADIRADNAASIAAYTNIGFREHKAVYWLYMHPSASGPCPFSW